MEEEIKGLSPGEPRALRQWFLEYDAAEWDKQIEEDALAGKLDTLAAKALADHRAGMTSEI